MYLSNKGAHIIAMLDLGMSLLPRQSLLNINMI